MNIFYLHYNVKKCAIYHLDRHVVKMILETCQLLCTAIWLAGGEAYCKPTHKNHPSAIWCRANKSNWIWLKNLGIALCEEYTYRYGKKHRLEDIIRNLEVPSIPDGDFYEPTQAMPEEYKDPSSLIAYRNYYILGKKHLHFWKTRHAWKKRAIPNFILFSCPWYENFL
jgi:hypothetical protein